jgi:NADH-quinone oxidoreductase subunit C
MENITIIDHLKIRFGADLLDVDETTDVLSVTVSNVVLHDCIQFLKEATALQFTFLTDITGVHYPDSPLALCSVYHLHNLQQNKRVRVKTFVSVDDPRVKTVTDLFSAANWMERETYDFYGIIYDDHPNLKRILNVEYMDYFPMRKEFPLEDQTREDKDDRFFGR